MKITIKIYVEVLLLFIISILESRLINSQKHYNIIKQYLINISAKSAYCKLTIFEIQFCTN